MSMEKIKWEYIEGVPALVNLTNMIGTAISEALPNEKTRRIASWNWIGYYIGEGTDLWVGIRYNDPLNVIFENNTGNSPTYERNLPLLKLYFFSLTSGEQLESFINFIKNSHVGYEAK